MNISSLSSRSSGSVTMENFDAIGRWRDTENGRPVDTTSHYDTPDGETVMLSSARDVAELAISSEAAHRAFVIQLFQHMTKHNPGAYGPEVIERLRDAFAADQFHIQNLMVRTAVLSARHGSKETDASTPEGDDATHDEPSRDTGVVDPQLVPGLNLGHEGD